MNPAASPEKTSSPRGELLIINRYLRMGMRYHHEIYPSSPFVWRVPLPADLFALQPGCRGPGDWAFSWHKYLSPVRIEGYPERIDDARKKAGVAFYQGQVSANPGWVVEQLRSRLADYIDYLMQTQFSSVLTASGEVADHAHFRTKRLGDNLYVVLTRYRQKALENQTTEDALRWLAQSNGESVDLDEFANFIRTTDLQLLAEYDSSPVVGVEPLANSLAPIIRANYVRVIGHWIWSYRDQWWDL